ncbi:MAG: SMP-30/gluconolactonase/LRE family protein [Actinomycetota bacterium]|nr:SMP-30/gluconolactonase/LRE family protein [Actinomycetota bacterium]
MERIASGYQLVEGPVATPEGGVVFSDVLGGGVYEWSPATGEVTTVVAKRRGIGGMARHADGGLVMSGRDVIHVAPDGESRTIYTPGEGVAGINDLTVDPDGRIVVGQLRFRPFAGEKPVPGEFVAVGGDAPEAPVVDDVLWVNGCQFSPDGSIFYGCDVHRGVVLAADRNADGTYSGRRVVIEAPTKVADGMAVDETGAVWVALGPSGSVGRFTPDGLLDQEVKTDAAFVASVCFGGADGKDLFATTIGQDGDVGAVFHGRVDVAGAPITLATV